MARSTTFTLTWHDNMRYTEDADVEYWKEIRDTVESAVAHKFAETDGINYCFDVEFYENEEK